MLECSDRCRYLLIKSLVASTKLSEPRASPEMRAAPTESRQTERAASQMLFVTGDMAGQGYRATVGHVKIKKK